MANLAGFSSGAFGAIINHFTRHQDDPEQTKWKYKNQEIDPQRTWMNYAIQQIRAPKDFIQAAIDSVDVPVKTGKKATNVLSDWVITLPKNELLEGREKEFFEQTFEFMKTKVPEDLIVGGYVHMDETSPHMHFAFVPLVTTQAMTNDKNQPLRDGKGKILKDKKGTTRYKRVPKLDADGNPIMRRSFGQSKIFDRKAMENFHPQLEKALSDYFGFKVGIELEDEGERLLSSLSQPQYIKAKQTLEKQQQEIAQGEERLECLQGAQEREEKAIGAIESEIRAIEVSAAGAGDIIGSKAETRELEAEIAVLEQQVRHSERRAGELGNQVERARSAVDERLADTSRLERGIERCENEKLAVERESSRIEKACGILSRALDRGASAVAQAFAKLIRTNDLRQSTWSFAERTIAEAMCETEISELKERPAKNKLDKAIAQVEYRIEKFKARVRYGFAPKKGLIEALWKKKSDLESQTPEAIAIRRNHSAKGRIIGLCSNIFACRGPKKEQIKAEIAKFAADKTLWADTRNFAKGRIAWIDAGAPAGAPAGSGSNPAMQNRTAAQQGGEARERSIGGDAR